MKVGDKVICKKSIENDVFKCENEYIVEIIDNGIYIISDKPFKFTSGRWFNMDKTTGYQYDFDDYFYSKKEYRKKKLEKLNAI
jgi:hypothetical protein